MTDDAPKSSLELAMERLKQQDAEQGVSDRPLTEDQKNEIADVRKTYGRHFRARSAADTTGPLPARRRTTDARTRPEDRKNPDGLRA